MYANSILEWMLAFFANELDMPLFDFESSNNGFTLQESILSRMFENIRQVHLMTLDSYSRSLEECREDDIAIPAPPQRIVNDFM